MFRRHHNSQIPELNTTSTADISFMLLIFFLVTSSMDTDKGLLRQMPPPPEEHQQPLNISEEHVMTVVLAPDGTLSTEGDIITAEQLTQLVKELVERDRLEHVIQVDVSPTARYGDYFRMQNAVVAAYNELRNNLAEKRFHRPYKKCTTAQKAEVCNYYPQRISEKGGEV